MNIKIIFQHMDHSDAIEQYVRQKLSKVTDFFKNVEEIHPFNIELRLKSGKTHAHHYVEMHLKTPRYELDAHDECTDMYMAIDNVLDKMAKQVVKQKEKSLDKHHKRNETEKNKFKA